MTDRPDTSVRAPLSLPEFVAMTAMLFATIALSMDAMLPALPEIADELTPDDPNRAQLIISSFVLGMGVGTFFAGPISDTYGRKTVILWGAFLYSGTALLAWQAPSFETMLLARVLQGIGAAGTRVVALAMVRDLYEGRRMAQVVSFVLMVFILVPAVAPLMGAVIIEAFGWREIFLAFVVFSAGSAAWLGFRQPETLAPENRRPLRAASLAAGVREVLSYRVVRYVILIQSLAFAILFSSLVSVQPVFDITYGRAESFPVWFALIAVIAGTGNLLNAALVRRLGMRFMVQVGLSIQIVFAGVLALLYWLDVLPEPVSFGAYVVWTISLFFIAGLTLGNLNAIAMEPLGHVAGMTASVVGSLATVGSVLVAVPIGLAFDGTPAPQALGVFLSATVAMALMRQISD